MFLICYDEPRNGNRNFMVWILLPQWNDALGLIFVSHIEINLHIKSPNLFVEPFLLHSLYLENWHIN